MATGSGPDVTRLEQLSALVDGELDDAATALSCAHWRDDAAVRATWHAYHVIGDVLRSDDLASDPARDAEFVRCLRGRLAAEPAVLAPGPVLRERGSSAASVPLRGAWWKVSAAVAAGFVAVAGVFMLTRGVEPGSSGDTAIARADAPAMLASMALGAQRADASTALDAAAGVPVPVSDRSLIRDARLDAYLAAHKQFAGSSALGVPSAFLRSVTVEAPRR
jgi:sigma-E factor negative regulatory protein RseA